MANKTINLLKSEKIDVVETILSWALTAGRFIVIVTECIALGSFLYRFTLDRQLIDLHDEIKKKQTVVAFLKPNEDKYRSLQTRLAIITAISSNSEAKLTLLKDVKAVQPQDLLIDNFFISDDTVRLNGSALRLTSLTRFIRSLKGVTNVRSVSLTSLQNKTSIGTILFSLSIGTSTK